MGRSRPRIKKIPFLAPSTCPIALFGLLANGRLLKRLHDTFIFLRLVSYSPLARLRRARLGSGVACNQESPRLIAGVTSTGQSHTYWPEAHRARCIQCIQTSAVLQGGQAPARPTAAQTSSLEHEHPLRTCSHCTKSCGNRGHAYTRSQRGATPQSTACRPPRHRPQATRRPPKNNAARRVTNAQALGISLTLMKRTLCHP